MQKINQKAYGAYAKSDKLRMESSSGGVFSVLAEQVLAQGGAVWGAAFDQNFNVVYQCAEKPEALAALRGSKYVFLPIAGLAEQMKPQLAAGKPVLAVVSPCQAAALRRQLGDPENLLLVDFVCHGAPDAAVWQQYLQETTQAAGGPVDGVNFRKKTGLWTDYKMELIFPDGSVLSSQPQNNPYMQAFLANLSIREACTRCTAKGESRGSDLTLGDFWGVNKVCPEIYEKTGTSLVFVNTQAGQDWWDRCGAELVCHEVSPAEAVRFNPSAVYPSAKGEHWLDYQSELAEHTLAELAKAYCTPDKSAQLKSKVKGALKRLLGR